MAAQVVERRAPSRSLEFVGVALGAGLALGAAVSLVAFLLARYGPVGGNWSFRGNGALAAYTLLPAILAGGWTAVVLRHRRRPWRALAAAAAGAGVVLAVLDAALLPIFGVGADVTVGPILLLALVAWCVIAPALAMWLPKGDVAGPASIGTSIGAAFLWAAGLVAGLLAVGFVVPAGS
jgi:hypothetical protein